MTLQSSFIYSLFCSFLIISISCKKPNETYPEVEILSPKEGARYSFGDTILVSVKVKDADGAPILNVLDGSVNIGLGYSQTGIEGDVFNFEVYNDNTQIETKDYTIRAVAYNGSNKSSDFQDIYLEGLPLEYLGFVAITENSIVQVDRQGALETKLLDDYDFLEYNAHQNRAVIGAQIGDDLRGYSCLPLRFEYNVLSTTGVNGYNALVDDGQRIFSLASNGEIKAYDTEGGVVRSFLVDENIEPLSGCFGDEGLLLGLKERGKSNYYLQLVNPANGAVLKNTNLPSEVKSIVRSAQDLYTITTKASGQTGVYTYQPSGNVLTQILKLPNEPVCMLLVSSGLVLISTSENIYQVNPSAVGAPNLIFNFGASDMELEVLQNEVFIASGAKVYRGSISGLIYETYQMPQVISQLEIVYSK